MSDPVNPFQSPQTDSQNTDEAAPPDAKPIIPFESGHARAMFVVTFLLLSMVVDLTGAGVGVMEIGLLQRMQAGEDVDDDTLSANDMQVILVGLIQVGLLVITGIAFLMWFHRSHRNLPALGAKFLQYSPRWAVGGFFVPFLNLFRPYQVMREVWTESDPFSVEEGGHLMGNPASTALVGWWWTLWIVCGILGQAAFRLTMHDDSLDTYLVSSWLTLGCDIVSALDAVLAIMLVRRIDANQLRRHEILGGSPTNNPFQGLSQQQ